MARNFVYSTLTNDQNYVTWIPPVDKGGMPRRDKTVFIRGGANRATKQLITPHGVRTEVSDSQLEHLEQNEMFKRHKKNGFIKVTQEEVDPEVAVASDMEQRDDSSPHTPETIAAEAAAAGSTEEVKILEGDEEVKSTGFNRLKRMMG